MKTEYHHHHHQHQMQAPNPATVAFGGTQSMMSAAGHHPGLQMSAADAARGGGYRSATAATTATAEHVEPVIGFRDPFAGDRRWRLWR
ncbi:unnamed protein product [Macrosiphum euphorbiae]|uniref:Uncharacterized protein n=1 Tax=Macrosiphum euphorbiae TaxID=13131 RepID=A0AAV0W4Y8_9HEMI|nr:unnamed protein product [Macrosiphum euphorbiae]